MRLKRYLIFFLLLCCSSYLVSAQDKMDAQLELYSKKIASPTLFVHYDKNIYTNNETIWFTAYLLNGPKADTSVSVFSVVLIRNIDSAVVMDRRFIMQDGFSYGSLALPNVMSTGDYRLIAYTNQIVRGRPVIDFTQQITIKTTTPQPVNINLKTLPDQTGDQHAKVLISATTKENKFFKKAANISYAYGNTRKTAKTDLVGQFIADLPLADRIADPRLNVKVKYESDSGYASLVVKARSRKAVVRFYPEGGNLVNGLQGTVGFEAKDQYDSALEVKGQLYKDNAVVEDIELTDYGVGKFQLTPQKGSTYYIRLLHSGLKDSTYYLPAAIDQGVAMTMSSAIAADTLRFTLKSDKPVTVYMRLHNFKNTFVLTRINVKHTQNVAIPLTDMPRGLATVTISDSLERPIAERMCFLHYNNEEKLNISTDSAVYGIRKKVTLKLKLDSATTGVVSIACVQDNRIDPGKATDITQYIYLEKELQDIPFPTSGKKLADKEYLENILLVKGWRRYNWKDVLQTTPQDTLITADHLIFKGTVLSDNKPVKKPFVVSLFKNSGIDVITTDANGAFYPSIENLEVEAEKNVGVFLSNNKYKSLYSFKMEDGFSEMNKKLAAFYPLKDYDGLSILQDNSTFVIKKDEKALNIKEVEITNKKDDLYISGPNECGDYICPFNILNCRNHPAFFPGNISPVIGEMYSQWIGNSLQRRIYMGCNGVGQTNLIPGINIPKEFYIDDYTNPVEPAFFSTLLWKHAMVLEQGKETKVEFYTSDIRGKFRVIVQGVTNDDVISGQGYFEVKGN